MGTVRSSGPGGKPVGATLCPASQLLPPEAGHTQNETHGRPTEAIERKAMKMNPNFLVFLGLATGLGLGSAALAGPNLVAEFNTTTGNVKIRNVGNVVSFPSTATVECIAQGGGSCPDPNPAAAAPYENAAFPNKASFGVPAVIPGGQHNHVLGFWAGLAFAPGTYTFIVCADAGAAVAEDSERDNCSRAVKRVRGRPTGPGGLTSNSPGG